MSAADANASASRLVAAGSAVIATSVFTDSALEHYRGSFRNPAMVLPLAASMLSIVFNGSGAGNRYARRSTHGGSALVGLIGLIFHAFNIAKRGGGVRLTNLFYGAPVGAPAALVLAGTLGAVADGLRTEAKSVGNVWLSSGRSIGTIAVVGIAGTVLETTLLHFRGAYQNPAMWLPVTLPPLAAGALLIDVIRQKPGSVTYALLGATFVLGIAGVGFHARGVSRRMGGWRNWRQNLLVGPPIPAPPAFTGLALVGLGALLLMRRRTRG